MKILFWGSTTGNCGPVNINKGIVKNLTNRFDYVTTVGKYRELAEALWKLLYSDVVVVSGVSRKGCILVGMARILGKKSVYIMHGSNAYECKLNNRIPERKGAGQETYLLAHSDLLLPVSRKFMHWVHEQYPQYADKTGYLYNGIDSDIFDSTVWKGKEKGSVAVSGGMTPLKNNIIVARAVEALNGKAVLTIYGDASTASLPEKHYTRWAGTLPQEAFLQDLKKIQLFVLNSTFESFSISVIQALACGCSILVSEIAGVTDLLSLEETDIIHDPLDTEEIRGKIEYLLEHPNNDRILSQFNADEWAFDKMVERLEEKCRYLIQNH